MNKELIKERVLRLKLKEAGINRTSNDSIKLIRAELENHAENLIKKIKERMILEGKKSLKEKEIKTVLSEVENKNYVDDFLEV
jgi:histone H3/H4